MTANVIGDISDEVKKITQQSSTTVEPVEKTGRYWQTQEAFNSTQRDLSSLYYQNNQGQPRLKQDGAPFFSAAGSDDRLLTDRDTGILVDCRG